MRETLNSTFPTSSYTEGFQFSDLPLTIRKAVEEARDLPNPTALEKP